MCQRKQKLQGGQWTPKHKLLAKQLVQIQIKNQKAEDHICQDTCVHLVLSRRYKYDLPIQVVCKHKLYLE